MYYTNPQIINQYKILIYPHPYPDKFEFSTNDQKQLIIKRLDSDSGWEQILRIKIINLITHNHKIIKVGFSNYNKYIRSFLSPKDIPEIF